MTKDRSNRRGTRPASGWFVLLREAIQSRAERGRVADLHEDDILAWADSHHGRTGKWPNHRSGFISQAPLETGLDIEAALFLGLRGLPGRSTLAQFLQEHRGKWNRLKPQRLTRSMILAWADAFYGKTGRWPGPNSGAIPQISGLTWAIVNNALVRGRCGLPGGTCLARLLEAGRGVPYRLDPPRLDQKLILGWIDAHRRRTGRWPTRSSGVVAGAGGLSWATIDTYLMKGGRGLPGGSSLTHLLVARRGVLSKGYRPPLNERKILAWADAFHRRTRTWPNHLSGSIPESPADTWSAIHQALYEGLRGFPGGSSLAELLARERGVRNIHGLPNLTKSEVLRWARLHRRRTGSWPTARSGDVRDAPGEKWVNVFQAFHKGLRGQRPGQSLSRLIRHALG